MSDGCSAIVEEVFLSLLNFDQDSSKNNLDLGLSFELAEYLQFPKGIGGVAYKDDVTAYRIMGSDQGYPQLKPRDVPQKLINHYCRSFSKGLEQAFPTKIIIEYMCSKLEKKAFSDFRTGSVAKSRIEEFFLVDFPNIMSSDPPVPKKGNLKNSWEFDIRRDFADKTNILNTRHDRKQLSNQDIVNFYLYSAENPELIAAFFLWQEHIANYCQELKVLGEAHFSHLFDKQKENSLDQYLDEVFPISHVIRIAYSSISMSNIPLFFGAAIVAAKSCDSADSLVLSDGILAAQRAGIFVRTYESEFGKRKITCPWASTSARWLLSDFEIEGTSQSAIDHYYNKILTEREEPKVKEVLCEIKRSIGHLLNSAEQGLIHGSQKNVMNGCPFHNE